MFRPWLRAFSDWGWGVKLLLVPAAPVGHSLLSAVGALTAASWGPEGGRPNLSDELRGNRLPLGSGLLPGSPRPSSPRERHGSAPRAETRSLSGGSRHRALLAPAELGTIGPHPVQDGDVLDNMAHAALGFVLVVPRNELRRRAG